MNPHSEYLKRVRDNVRTISALASGGLNIPVESVIDKTSLNALCDSLNLEPEDWRVEDLEKILLIRDGLYTLRNKLRDDGDDGEYSVDQLLSAMDRLYADLERAMRTLTPAEVQNAHADIAALQRTPHVEARRVPAELSELRSEANELLTRTHITYQKFEFNVIKVENLEVLRNAKLVIQRLSASVFAIKLSLEHSIIYQGVFRFLSEGADKIVNELRKLAEQFRKTYQDAKEFLSDLSSLVEKSSRFTRHIAKFLHDIFGDTPPEQKQLRLKTRTAGGRDTMLCGLRISDTTVLVAGKNGFVNVVDVGSGKVVDQHQISASTINCLARHDDLIVAGSDTGLETINPNTLVSFERDSVYTENVFAVAAPSWGVLSGTRDGIIRRWGIDNGFLQRYGAENLKIGKSVQRMLVHQSQVLVASGETLLFVDEHLQIVRRIPIDFIIRDMCLLNHATLILCGDGKLAHLNLQKGVYTRFIAASESTNYTCVSAIDENTFCSGSDDGTLTAIDLQSNAEIGETKVPFPVRGLTKMSRTLVAYGGAWQGKSKDAIATITWEEILHKSKEVTSKR